MAEKLELHDPWLIAVWPGMGQVALNAGYYLLSKLEMHLFASYDPMDFFDVEHVEVKQGIITTGQRPRNRFFVWTDPKQKHDLIVFLGEAQPPLGKYRFCQNLIDFAKEMSVKRVFTFAAMATQMHPEHACRVFGAATESESLEELKQLELNILQDGHIGGLNGVLLGVAAERGLRGACLLGEIPHILHQLPFPKASKAILEVFATISGLEIDFTQLDEQSKLMDQQLGELLSKVEQSLGSPSVQQEEEYSAETPEEKGLQSADENHIEKLFELAQKDRSKAFELKHELDRLGVFSEYEDRFLDLFKKAE